MTVIVTVNNNLEEEMTSVRSMFVNRDFVSIVFDSGQVRTFEKVLDVKVVI